MPCRTEELQTNFHCRQVEERTEKPSSLTQDRPCPHIFFDFKIYPISMDFHTDVDQGRNQFLLHGCHLGGREGNPQKQAESNRNNRKEVNLYLSPCHLASSMHCFGRSMKIREWNPLKMANSKRTTEGDTANPWCKEERCSFSPQKKKRSNAVDWPWESSYLRLVTKAIRSGCSRQALGSAAPGTTGHFSFDCFRLS